MVPSAPEGVADVADRTSGAGEDFLGIPPAAAWCCSSEGSNRLTTGDSDA